MSRGSDPKVLVGPHIGARAARQEDRPLVTGAARHVGDIRLPDMLHVALVRSVFPHATLNGIDTAAATAAPGVVAVYTASDLEGNVRPLLESAREEISRSLAEQVDLEVACLPMPVLASDRVLWVGQPVAAVVATDPYLAEDARDLVDVDYEPLPPVVDARRALQDGAPILHPEIATNAHARIRVETGDADAALREAEHTLVERFELGRQVANAIEPRGVLAVFDPSDGLLTIWGTNTKPHLVRTYVSNMLGLAADDVRFIAPDMGGSFGGGVFPEDVLVPFLAMDLRRSVRWLEDRSENLLATCHGRDQVHDVEVGFCSDGTIVALRDRFVVDSGAYNTFAITVAYNTVAHLRGQYRIDHFTVDGTVALSNRAPAAPVRGSGRPEAAFVMERLIDLVAGRLGMDTVEVRLANLIRPEDMPYDMGIPYRDGVRMSYEEGDFPGQLRSALEVFGYEAWRAQQRRMRAGRRRIGIGIASFVEGSGHGPYEGAIVRVDESGHVTVLTGARPHGQGHATTLAQVAADQLGVDPARVTVRAGDTGLIPYGRGSYASRTAVVAGNAVALAGAKLRRKILDVAGGLLAADPADLVIEDGRILLAGVPECSVDLRDVAAAAAPGPASRVGTHEEPGLQEEHYFVPPTATFGSGTHIAAVEVDAETGVVNVLDYVTVDDCGRMLNPAIVEGQIHGGVAHGIGNALLEEAVYDDDGQLLTSTYVDYLLPTTSDVPAIRVAHQEYPSPRNPLGVKGVGEGGAVASPAAIVNAVEDALRPLPVRLTRIPLTPERLLSAIHDATGTLPT